MGPPSAPGTWIDPDQLSVHQTRTGALPVVGALLARLGFDELMASALPDPDARCGLEPAKAIGVLVRNLALGRFPLYGLDEWAQGYEPSLLGLAGAEGAALNDDKVGRALDELFWADRASLLTELSLRTIRRYGIDVSELHNDSTSITLYGTYRKANGADNVGVRPPRPARGHSKDHRGDLLQLVEILSVSADGAVSITYRLADGNTEDLTTHVATWNELVSIIGTPGFTYVADSKLATRDNMDHIAGHGGRFLSILPRSRKESETGRAWIASGTAPFAEIARRPARHKDGPPEVYWAAEAPTPSAEGFRIVWIRSSQKRALDAAARTDRIEQARSRLAELAESLASLRCQLKSKAAVARAADEVRKETGAKRWMRVDVSDHVEHQHRQVGRGRPGKDTVYRRIEHHRFSLAFSTDAAAVAFDAASDGCFPLVTNERLTPAELLGIYKSQPHLERRHVTYKGVIEAAPIMLKSDSRIDALGFCLYVALLVHALVERELRRAMVANGIKSLALYYEDRACAAPTAARVFELLHPLVTTTVSHAGEVLSVLAPTLDPLQEQILTLLEVPLNAYRPAGQAT
jgi:transposase